MHYISDSNAVFCCLERCDREYRELYAVTSGPFGYSAIITKWESFIQNMIGKTECETLLTKTADSQCERFDYMQEDFQRQLRRIRPNDMNVEIKLSTLSLYMNMLRMDVNDLPKEYQ